MKNWKLLNRRIDQLISEAERLRTAVSISADYTDEEIMAMVDDLRYYLDKIQKTVAETDE